MKLLNAAVTKISKFVKGSNDSRQDMSKLTEGYLRRYPVRSFGIPVASVDDLLLSYKLEVTKLIPAAAIRLQSNYSDEPTFENLYKKTIRNLASYVHLLPASEYHHHHELGGLLYHSLQTAHGCLEKARSREGQIPRDKETSNIDVFQVIKPKWIYGAWALGLIHDIGKVLLDITVFEHGDEKNVWNPLNESLVDWANRTNVSSYETKMAKNRKHGAHEEVGALLVKEIISKEGLDFIRGGGPMLISQVYQYMSGKYMDGAFLHQVVKYVDGLETARDINMRWDKHLGESRVNVEKIFISSARSLLPTLKVNEPKGKIFICGGRAFITVAAIDQIIAYAKNEKYKQFPSSTKGFCEALMEAGVVEPIRDRDGEPTDEWFGILKPSIGNDYRVIKLVSPLVIYWEGETPRSIAGEYIVGNSGVKEIYQDDGTLQVNADVEQENDEVPEQHEVTENQTDNSDTTPDDSNSSEAEEIVEQPAQSESQKPEEKHVNNSESEEEIPRPKVKKPVLVEGGKRGAPTVMPVLEVEDMGDEDEDTDLSHDEDLNPEVSIENKSVKTEEDAQSKDSTDEVNNKQTEEAVAVNADSKAPMQSLQKKLVKKKQVRKSDSSEQQTKQINVDSSKKKPQQKRKKVSRFETDLTTYLTTDLNKKMQQGELVYIDGSFALSVNAISEISNDDYMTALPQLKSKAIINNERGVRKINVNGEDKVMVVINEEIIQRIVDEKGIDVESIELVEKEKPTFKDKNNRASDLIANSEVADNKDDFASQVKQLLQSLDFVIQKDDGIYIEYAKVTRALSKVSKENREMLQAEIAKGHQKELEDKTYIRILESDNER